MWSEELVASPKICALLCSTSTCGKQTQTQHTLLLFKWVNNNEWLHWWKLKCPCPIDHQPCKLKSASFKRFYASWFMNNIYNHWRVLLWVEIVFSGIQVPILIQPTGTEWNKIKCHRWSFLNELVHMPYGSSNPDLTQFSFVIVIRNSVFEQRRTTIGWTIRE